MANDVGPAIITIFGAKGDLAKRKLMPALYNLFLDNSMPDKFLIIGAGRDWTEGEFCDAMHDAMAEFSRRGAVDEGVWAKFGPNLTFLEGGFEEAALYNKIADKIQETEGKWRLKANRIYYLSTPPSLIDTIVQNLAKAHLSREKKRDRVVIEKPFGRDLASAEALNRSITTAFTEKQIYRIDHYLGKETVQNVLALRFANAIYEPVWNRRYIDHVQITVGETVGVEQRGGYYETSGALRDMIQNHLLQVMCLIAMEPPVAFEADEIRSRKVDVLRAVRPLTEGDLYRNAVRGQYGPGWLDGKRVPGYRQEDGVSPQSSTETYAALKLFVDNWRWQDVPFYLRTGKRMPKKVSQASIVFKPVPHQMFPSTAADHWEPNRLILNIQPREGIVTRFQAKQPGKSMRLQTVNMEFFYEESFKTEPPEAYETLLYDVMCGDGTLFMRADQEHAAWSVINPVLETWSRVPSADFPNYAAGTWGPEAAEALIARDGRSWQAIMPDEQSSPDGQQEKASAAAKTGAPAS
jgi:glucose-6-phosphate 1-dehydrogenase